MSFKTDLHIHSWYSDGTMSPAEIVKKYAEDKYDLISLTDHETTGGIKEAEKAGKENNIRVISGIEIATMYGDKELHILGYYFDPDNERLSDKMKELAEIRRRRNWRLMEVLREMGFDIEEKDLVKREGQNYVGKPDFARALIKKGYISEISEAFEPEKFLESKAAKETERRKPETEEIIELIKDAGGLAVLAHPGKIKNLGERGSERFKLSFDVLLKELKKIGLKGLECIYPSHTDEERLFFIDEAAKYHLHITEGSDYHGDK